MVVKQMLPISVCIIASNEARRIARTLESVKGWTAEIILAIDDRVTDGTDKIGSTYGARVFSQPWRGHASHRNFASSQATQPWLLAIDADEVVSDQLRGEIISAFQKHDAGAVPAAYNFPRCTFFCGRLIRHGDWYPDRKARLWRRGQAFWSGEYLHEKLVVDGCIEKLRGDLLHYSMDSLDHFTRKSIMVSDLFVRQNLEHGRRAVPLEMWIRPYWRFLRGYFFKLGFLDGWQGYAIARMVAFETFLRYAKLREAQLSETKITNHLNS
jgi:glycosyltransferase involved in cell wall biosynthesis